MSEYRENEWQNGCRHSEIIYEEGWREAEEPPVQPDTEEPPVDEVPKAEVNDTKPLLVTIRLALCLIAAAALLILRAADSEWYHEFMTCYRVEMNRPVIAQDFFEALDLSRIFGEDGVRVKASPDEIPNW